MRITFVARREALEVDLPESAWKHKQSDFCIARTNSSQPDLQQVFVKRFRDTEPDAHPLLLGSAVRPLPNAPSLLHCESQDGFHYYVYTLLVGYKDLSFYLHSGGDYSRILSPSSARVLLAQMTQTLADINQRGYFHPDVCWGNIMARFRRDQIPSFALIDLDSCLSLKTRQLPSGVKCDQTWWSLYLHSGLRDPVYLNPTMILGIGLVLCRLLGEPPSGRNGSRAREVLLGRHEDQRALFEACDRGDNGKFIDTFSPAQSQAEQISGILSAWGQILSSMRAGRATPWTDIQQILDSLIAIQVHSNKRSMTGAKRGAEVAKPGIATTRSASRNETIGAEIASSLKTMIANAPSGATIRLAAGTYEVEHTLVIRKRLTLVGAGIDATIIVGYADNCLLACETDESVTLRDLTIRRSGHRCGDILRCGKGTLEVVRCRLAGAKKKNEALGNGLLAHTQGHVSVVQCVLEENDNDGIAVTETAHASVEACTFDRNGSGIAFYDNASGTVRHNTVEDCREYGIYVGKQASPFLEENACYRNARAGIAVVEQAGPTLAGNTCNTNSRSGISISSSSVVVVRENSCAENGQSGISISGQAQAILARNTCQTNALSGIAYFDHATGEARDNSSANNQKCGISVNSQSQPELISNVCRQNGGGGIGYFGASAGVALSNSCSFNGGHGVFVGEQARPTLEGNACEGNEWSGVGVCGEAQPYLTNNTCRANRSDGISLWDESAGIMRWNTCTDNERNGIAVSGRARPVLENNTCENNGSDDIGYWGNATGTARGNWCSGNRENGILVLDQARPILDGNHCGVNIPGMIHSNLRHATNS